MRAWLSALFCAAALTGCANYATLQDPETVPKKTFQLGMGATFNRYVVEFDDTMTTSANGVTTETHDEDAVTVTVPALTLSGRYGVSERLEAHGMVWLPFGASIGGKYMLVGDREQGGFAFSPGLDVSVPITVSNDDRTALLFDAYVPLHTGYRFSPGFALYLTPKYVLRVVGSDVGHAAGGTLGVAIGKDTQLLFEGGALYDTLFEQPIINGAIGVAFM